MADSPPLQQTSSVPAHDLTGITVGRFAIRARLGAGGMGEVYLADDTKLKRHVALKRVAPRLRSDPSYRRRLLSEAQRASFLSDQHIAHVYDVFEENDETFLVMEYVQGVTLRHSIHKPAEVKDFLNVAVQCAQALVAAHEKRIVHCDIKPENILLTPDGQVKILDFGVAKGLPERQDPNATETAETQSGPLIGTPAYMAPEVLLGKEPDGRADIFSLGVVFYEALAGRHPFRAPTSAATNERILHEDPPSLDRPVPAELKRILAKMLAKDPAERYATAADLLVDLHALERGRPAPQPWKFNLRVAAVLALLASVCGVSYWVWHPPLPGPNVPSPISTTKRLAVLPFENLSEQTEDEYFADGLTAELITKLSRIRSLEVISRISATRFKKPRLPISEIARQLDVAYIVSGSVQRAHSEVRITVALEEVGRGTQLWARDYDRPFNDVLEVENEVANNVVQSLALVLGTEERAALMTTATQNPQAFDAYLRGKSLVVNFNNRGRDTDFGAAEKALREAITLDPQMSAAYSEQAWLYYLHDLERARPTPDRERARVTAENALALDPRQVDALMVLAMMYGWYDENEKAYSYAQKVLEVNPHEPRALVVLGHCYRNWGLLEEALETFQRAGRMDPLYIYPITNVSVTLGMLGRFDEAWSENEKAAILEADNWGVLLNRIWIRYHENRLEEAGRLAEEGAKRLPSRERPLAEVFSAWILSRRGQHEPAREVLRRSQGTPILRASLGFQMWLAEGLALENKKEESLAIIEKVAMKRPDYPWLVRNTNFDPLRNEPRFQDLLVKLRHQWEEYRLRYSKPASR